MRRSESAEAISGITSSGVDLVGAGADAPHGSNDSMSEFGCDVKLAAVV